MGRNTKKFIDAITEAAKSQDYSAIHHNLMELKDHLDSSGAPIEDALTINLINSFCESGTYESIPQRNDGNPYTLIKKIVKAADKKAAPEIRAELRETWQKLHDLLANPLLNLEAQAADELVKALRQTREHFDLLGQSADRFINRGYDPAMMYVYYAQALVDTGHPLAAIKILEGQLNRPGIMERHYDEVRGLLGRANKQIYINYIRPQFHQNNHRERYEPFLHAALAHYGDVYDINCPGKNIYQGINFIALLALARRHGVDHGYDKQLEEIAKNLISETEPKYGIGLEHWDIFTLAEAYVALGDYENALKYYTIATEHEKTDRFEIGSALRQLEEVWQSENTDRGIDAIIIFLKEQLSKEPEAQFVLTKKEYKLLQKSDGELGRVFERSLPGGKQYPIYRIYEIAIRAAAIAQIKTIEGFSIGTGFLMRASDLSSEYNDDLVLLTNAHVMWDRQLGKLLKKDGLRGGVTPGEAIIEFELPTSEDEPGYFLCKRVLWQSEVGKFDACVIQLDEQPRERKPIRPSKMDQSRDAWPRLKEKTPVTVIGHPAGRKISFASMGDLHNSMGYIMDVGTRHANEKHPIYLHYHIPTEGGNSGSPVLETRKWDLIGLHHAGFKKNSDGLRKLNGVAGTNLANEGVLISSIIHAIAKDMSGRLKMSETRRRADLLKRGI